MPENEIQGISRRDLLKRGAALGGAVVWATPVVQTLGMGRAFAANGTPVGGDISYIAIRVTGCAVADAPFVIKFDPDNGWELGTTPGCPVGDATRLGDELGEDFNFGVVPNGACWTVTVPQAFLGCKVEAFIKAGQDCFQEELDVGSQQVCTPA